MSLDAQFDSLKSAQERLALATRTEKDAALRAVAAAIDEDRAAILAANASDVARARAGGMKESLVDRLSLNGKRVDGMLEGLDVVLRQEDPIGRVLSGWTLPNGLFIEKTTVPMGVAAIIYESRPNVTVDAFCLAYKAGCAILLRGSSAALDSNRALVASIKRGLAAGGGEPDAVALADSGSRDEVDLILNARGKVDVVIPRGGRDLIRRVVENARVPVIETGEGNCHIFVDASADLPKAVDIVENAKMQKPGACNAVETVLVHRDAAAAFLPMLAARLAGRVELRLCPRSKAALSAAGSSIPAALSLKDAAEDDWATEYLDYILAVKVVDALDEAVSHVNRYGTKHSEAILTNDLSAAREFERRVDAACVYVNASIRFTDGGEFGFGAELGISTQKFHARGPMGLEALTTIKYRVQGTGQIRA
jgi:glutamate-5-semialdehyde dehydrogenase